MSHRIREQVLARYRSGTALTDAGVAMQIAPHSLTLFDYECLNRLARAEKAASTIETGLCLGFSALALLEAGCAIDDHVHVAIDPFESSIWGNAGIRAVREAGLDNRFEFFDEPSQLVLPSLLREGRGFDMAFIDGNHRFEHAFIDLYYLSRLVRPGGLIVVDDVDMAPVGLAVSYFLTNMGCRSVLMAPDTEALVDTTGLKPVVEGSRLTALRLPAPPSIGTWEEFAPFGASDEVSGRRAMRILVDAVIRRAPRWRRA
jgi:predicted O-methyltransferase YrrM